MSHFIVADGGTFGDAACATGEFVLNGEARVLDGGTFRGSGVISGGITGNGTVAPDNSPGASKP